MKKNRIIVDGESFHIQPDDINAAKHFFCAFGNSETEISAGWIVRFLQKRKQGWAPFTYEEIEAFYSRKRKDGFTFNRLIDPEMIPPDLARAFAGYHDARVPAGGGWIVIDTSDRYWVTEEFVERCHRSSPARQVA